MAFGSTLSLKLLAEKTGALDIETLTTLIDRTTSISHADGTGANQAAILWSDTRTLTTGATESLDLSGTALTDAFGAAVALTSIKGIVLVWRAQSNRQACLMSILGVLREFH